MKNSKVWWVFCSPLVSLVLSTSSFAEGFGFSGGADWGLGSMKNSTTSIKSRTMNTFEFHALPGYSFMGFLVGLDMNYRLVGQNTDPATVGGTNLKGNGYLLGLGGEYSLGMLTFSAAIDFIGKHKQGLNTTAGDESSYKKPLGFKLGAGYRIAPMIDVDALISLTSYSTNELAGADVDISSNKVTHLNFALGMSYHM